VTGANPLAAGDYQDPNDTARCAAEAAVAVIAALLAAGWRTIAGHLDEASIAAMLSAGGWLAVRGLVTRAHLAETMRPVTTALINLQDDVAAAAMAREVAAAARVVPPALSLPPAPAGLLTFQPPTVPALSPLPPPSVIALGFDPIDPALIQGQQRATSAFIDRLATTVEAVIDQDIRAGLSNGMGADEIARVIKATIGLTPRQAQAVANFRRLLENGDAAALDRVLRDRRFDASVQRAIDGGTLDPAKIDRMVERYQEKYIAYRARVIARTGTLRAANDGRRAAWAQYADRVGLADGDVLRWWTLAADERVCPVCRAIPVLNPNGVPLGKFYATPVGPVTGPPEPHPSCRCGERFEIREGARRRGG
jgi:hypothetical protein